MKNVITKIELKKDGTRVVYHATRGYTKTWTHKVGVECEVCGKGTTNA